METSHWLHQFKEENVVTDDDGKALSPLDNDYDAFKEILESLTDPLDDDYCKYNNE